MADPVYADIVAWMCGWLRQQLAARPEPFCADVDVWDDEPFPGESWPARLIIVRDDGGTRTSRVSGTRTVAFTVYAGSRATPDDAKNIAAVVASVIERAATTESGNPITGLRGVSYPFRVREERDLGRYYLSATFTVAAL